MDLPPTVESFESHRGLTEHRSLTQIESTRLPLHSASQLGSLAHISMVAVVPVCARSRSGIMMRLITSTLLMFTLGRRTVWSLPTKHISASSNKPSVAVIGGGIAGFSCASALKKGGKLEPTVFDTGRLRPGGRCSSRCSGDRPKDGEEKLSILSNSLFDHAAQIISVDPNDTSSDFAQQVAKWEAEGIVKRYPSGSVCDITKDGSNLSVTSIDKTSMYHGVNGMGSIPLAMVKDGQFTVEQDVWVSPSNGVKFLKDKRQWKVKGYDKTFDYLVIAHNGKCADRLMSRTPAKALHSLLRVNFNPTVPQDGGKRMTLNSIYSLTVCLKSSSSLSKALSPPFACGFVGDNKELRFISCQSRKYPRNDDMEVWTILSSPKFAKKYKAPQENLPDELVDDVTDRLLESVEELLDLQESSLRNSVVERRLQLWGAAVPLNTYKGSDGFVWDSRFGVGVCGDWLVEPSIAGAWESGRRLAEYMIEGGSKSIGLPTAEEPAAFQASASVSKAGIGSIQARKVILSPAA